MSFEAKDPYDAARDPVVLATWAKVREGEADRWVHGEPVGSGVEEALKQAASEIRNLTASPEYAEVLEDIVRFRRIPPLRRLDLCDELTRFEQRLREAHAGAVG